MTYYAVGVTVVGAMGLAWRHFTAVPTVKTEKPCAFCKPTVLDEQRVYQTSKFDILLDRNPSARGHMLVVPRRH
ncbi:MAG TPA: HIT domain-containing protein, partial [Chlamydiales bacterium]|nr:HIT domain-containing protein [Chlamydiales bacterium]